MGMPPEVKRVRSHGESPASIDMAKLERQIKKQKRKEKEEKFMTEDIEIGASTKQDSTNFFEQIGAKFTVKNKMDSTIHDVLPGGNYAVKFHPMMGFYLEKIEDFPQPKKIYGNTVPRARRIINSFLTKDSNLGVLLTGEKGAGKTMLGRMISKIAADELSIPTLFVTSDMSSEGFYQFLYKIRQQCIVFIDEYEKIFDKEAQETMLTLLDGVFQSKKMFILTCNDVHKIDQHLRNRPGRIHYALNFTGLDRDFIKEYCQDCLEDKSKVEEVANISSLFSAMNFDMLQSIVWEMNLYKESAPQVIEMLNAKPENDANNAAHDVRIILPEGFPTPSVGRDGTTSISGTPLRDSGFSTHIGFSDFFEMTPEDKEKVIKIFKPHLPKMGYFEYDDDDKTKVIDGSVSIPLNFTLADVKKLDFDNGTYIFSKTVLGMTFEAVVKRRQVVRNTYQGIYDQLF
jgi:SpoVK/Ycf46/Vps4 family AAA+-type ATPase